MIYPGKACRMISNRPCPVCRKHDGILLHTIKYPFEKDRILPVEYKIVSCSACGMVYDDFNATVEDFHRYYDQAEKYLMADISGSGGNSIHEQKRFQRTADILQNQNIDKNMMIMDIGSAKGGQLQCLKDNGFRNLCAVEQSRQCVEYMEKNGTWQVIHSSLENLRVNNKADLVICSQIFEHLFDPRHALNILYDVLVPSGYLLLDVPDASRYHEFFYKPYHYFDAEHINHFSYEYLKLMLESCGFKVIDSGTNENYLTDDIVYPNCYVLAEKVSQKTEIINKSTVYLENIKAYLTKSSEFVQRQTMSLSSVDMKKRYYIWGLGAYGLKLLDQGIFTGWNVAGLIDKDSTKQGKTVRGYMVYSPDILTSEENCAVCITSAVYEKEIRQELKNMGFQGDIIAL